MNLHEDARFIYIGKTKDSQPLAIPFPSIGQGAFETVRIVDAGRNANGAVVGQQIGRSMDKQNMGWRAISCEKWWEINNWFETNGMFFYCRYFSHNTGQWRTRKFYVSDIKCEPYMVNPATGIPREYHNATFNVVDTGWEDA